MSTQYYVLTHTDLDGTGCEIVARLLYDNPVVIRSEADQARVDEAVQGLLARRREGSGGYIIIADVCPREETLAALDDEGGVFIYDHHATAAGRCYQYPWAMIDQTRCGCKIMFEEESKRLERRIDPEVQKFIDAVDAYDRWQLGTSARLAGENLNFLHRFIWHDRMVRRGAQLELDDRERWLVECFKENIARTAEKVIKVCKEGVDEDGHRFVAVIADVFTSDVSEAIAQAYPEAEYVLVINPMDGAASIRVRNGQKLDVSKIAKKRGGGGHPEAAGYPSPIDVIQIIGAKPV